MSRSPISPTKLCTTLNLNLAQTKAFKRVLPALLHSNEAVRGRATVPTLPNERGMFRENLAVSQYRHSIEMYLDDPATIFAYPVFDSVVVGGSYRVKMIPSVRRSSSCLKISLSSLSTMTLCCANSFHVL
jgi:hypothetical protein